MDFRELVDYLRTFLPDYLEKNDIDPHNSFTCIRKDHEDKTPSASVYKDANIIRCFGCGTNYDIFDVANELHDLPIHGSGFITTTIPAIITELGLDIDIEKLDLGSMSYEKMTSLNVMKKIPIQLLTDL